MWICYVRCLRYRLPPSKHSPPPPVGHGRGLATRPGCAVPGEASVRLVCGSACRSAPRSKLAHAQPPPLRLRPASPTPGETTQGSCRLSGSQPLLAIARDSLCLPPVVPYRIRRGYCKTTLLPYPSASTGPATFLADPDHASVIRKASTVPIEAATAPEASGSGRCRCGATNYSAKITADASAITRFMYSSPLSVYRSFHCAPCGST